MFNPDAFFPVLDKIARILDEHGIRYHLTGGLVSIYYSEPRLTQEVGCVKRTTYVSRVQPRARPPLL